MPNWVSIRMTLSGPEHELARFRARCVRIRSLEDDATASLDFDALVPMPDKIVATLTDKSSAAKEAALAATGYDDWYYWRLAKWGVKWNADAYDEIRVSPGVYDALFDTTWSSPGPVFQAIAEQYPTLKGTIFAVSADEQFGLAGLIAQGAYTGIEVPISRELHFIVCESPYYDWGTCAKSSQALVEVHNEQDHPCGAVNHDADGETRVQQAWTAICSKLPAEFAERYQFRADLEGYHDWLSDPFDSVEDHVRSASHRSFFEDEGRFQTEADQRLMRLIDRALESELFLQDESLDPKNWIPVASLLATKLDDEVLCEWAAHAMYRPGVEVDLTTAETRQVSFAAYAIMMSQQVLEYLANQQ
jgi:hypothetical protein